MDKKYKIFEGMQENDFHFNNDVDRKYMLSWIKLNGTSLADLIFLYFDFFKLTKLIICAVHLVFNTSVKSLMAHGTSVKHHQLFPVIPVWPGGVPWFM